MNEIEKRIARTVGLTWSDGAFGIERGLCTGRDVDDILFSELSCETEDSDAVIALHLEEDDNQKREFIDSMAKQFGGSVSDSMRKWIYIVVSALKEEYGADTKNLLDAIERFYADMDYPPELAPFCRYMPSVKGIAGGSEAVIVLRLDSFLRSEAIRFG